MSRRIDDRWLWLGVGAALYLAVKGISYAIHDTVRLTQVKPLGKDDTEELERQPEDSIPLDVLRTLATSPNPNISKSAIDLIAARCIKSRSLEKLVRADASSSDTEVRRRAETAMRFLDDWKTDNEMDDLVPPGRRTGRAARGSPSRLSIDSGSYEFDRLRADSQADAAAARGWPVNPVNSDADEVLTMVSADVRGGSPNPNARHLNREAMVLQGSAELLDVGDVVRMPPT